MTRDGRPPPGPVDTGRPGRLECGLVTAIALVLPRGTTRDRYRQEFLADMYGLSRVRRLQHLLGLGSQVLSLRSAVQATSRSRWEEAVGPRPHRVWVCMLRHCWVWASTEDGGRYEACRRCGRERRVYGSASPGKFLGIG